MKAAQQCAAGESLYEIADFMFRGFNLERSQLATAPWLADGERDAMSRASCAVQGSKSKDESRSKVSRFIAQSEYQHCL